jgi:hypothetical protein
MSDTVILWDGDLDTFSSIGASLPSRYKMTMDGAELTLRTSGRAWHLSPSDVVVIGLDSVRCWTLATWLTMAVA